MIAVAPAFHGEQRVFLGRAAELCSTPLAVFMEFSAAHGVSPLSYELDDLASDEILREVHAVRDAYAAEHGYSLDRILADLKRREE
jgi:hypothetical protein